jgi:hypothetical protein
MSPAQRSAYLPSYLSALLKAAALNSATFDEANDWASCGVLMPPGKRVDNPWTMLQAGLVGMAWKVGRGGCMVCFFPIFVVFPPGCLILVVVLGCAGMAVSRVR